MELLNYYRFAGALLFVLALIWVVSIIARRFMPGGLAAVRKDKELSIEEVLPVDAKHRLCLIQRGEVRHLILIGPQQSLLVESNIPPSAKGTSVKLAPPMKVET